METYAGLLRNWQKVHNLVAASTLDVLWQRHMADSAPVARVAPEVTDTATTWVDLGSGAGFPGLVIAILLSDPERPRPAGLAPPKIHLVESHGQEVRLPPGGRRGHPYNCGDSWG